jgi:hypothetical protein
MKPGFICVAGIEPETATHIRPVLNHRRLGRELLRKDGGVFEIGALVDLGPTRNVGHAPEMEDHEFSVQNLRYRHRLKPEEFWQHLTRTSQDRLKAIFGDDLEQRDGGCTVDIGSGKASLGNLQPEDVSYFGVNPYGSIRIQMSDGEFHPDLSVTDIRLYENDQKAVRSRIVASVAARLPKTEIVLAVGLTRPWRKPGDTADRHWLQVNNVHLEDDPLGEIFEF